jgi:hypothetical protein
MSMHDVSVLEREFGPMSQWAEAPDWWVSTPERAAATIAALREATVKTIGRSAGGRELIALEYGEFEPLDATMNNLHSALASTVAQPDPTAIFPSSFYGSQRRRKPVVALQGAIHGGEVSGTVAMFHLCQVIETGCDLRGKPWPRLQELARASRILFIPWANPDGTSRMPFPGQAGIPGEVYGATTQSTLLDGVKLSYPACKNICPIPPERTAFMGTYYNDHGVNLQYDFCEPHRQPETTAWMEYYLAEKPDAVVALHCDSGTMFTYPEAYLPEGFQNTNLRIAGAVRARLVREGYPIGRASWGNLPGLGTAVMCQVNAIYHTCGALGMLCEMPAGCAEQFVSNDQMVDMGLIAVEELLAYAHTDGLRPYEYWVKVRRQLGLG